MVNHRISNLYLLDSVTLLLHLPFAVGGAQSDYQGGAHKHLPMCTPVYTASYWTLRVTTSEHLSIVTNKMLDTQFGFYPGRNTLQPMFISSSDICSMLRKKGNLMGHLGCMQPLLTSSRHMTPYLGVPFGSTSNAIASLLASLIKIIQNLYDADKHVLVDGT